MLDIVTDVILQRRAREQRNSVCHRLVGRPVDARYGGGG